MMDAPRYLLDTNIFNMIEDGRLDPSILDGATLYATHVQIDEFKQCSRSERTAALLSRFHDLGPEKIETAGLVWDVSRWDEACWGSEELLQKVFDRITELDSHARKRARDPVKNCWRDALLASTAIYRGIVLLTADANLATAAEQFGATVRLIQSR
ncbi:hypothetical protein [Xanthobacter sp. 126]|uniref:hypothetical protein n=1 Tax=Xanthobacter sp. 126 TaxID=1131814 RepID=UPI0012DFAA24|nr:hypothetical protein [Xanthobacter sp. 126]